MLFLEVVDVDGWLVKLNYLSILFVEVFKLVFLRKVNLFREISLYCNVYLIINFQQLRVWLPSLILQSCGTQFL